MVNVAANHAIVSTATGFFGNGLLEAVDIAHCRFDLVLEVLRQRPIRQSQLGACRIEVGVGTQGQFIQVVAQVGQPFGVLNDAIEMIAMNQPQAFAVGGDVYGFVQHLDSAKVMIGEMPRKLVVVARHKHHFAALAGTA